MRLAIVGIRGIPNNYGGFETLTEYLVEYLAKDLEITVYCSSTDMDSSLSTYKGARLKYLPISSHGGMGIIYDSICLIQALLKYDKVLFLGFGGGFVLPFFKNYGSKIILNIGGLDWKRNKWSVFAQKIIRASERLLIRYSGQIVSDNRGISTYISETYGRTSTMIAYGGDQAVKRTPTGADLVKHPFLAKPYALGVARIQEDNNITMMLDAFSANQVIPFVMIGNWNNSQYGRSIRLKYENSPNLILLDAIYDREKLDVIRSSCTFYIHGHSAGGTNPALVEAMYLGLPVFAYASGYNEFTTYSKALYFSATDELINLIKNYPQTDLKVMAAELEAVAKRLYRWKTVANQYKELIMRAS
jgi:glycosyltransferase involved in cell wall biosynthesis